MGYRKAGEIRGPGGGEGRQALNRKPGIWNDQKREIPHTGILNCPESNML